MIEVNPWSRQAGGPCPCRCRRSQQRLPQRESRPKQIELSSLEFPFLSRPAIHTSCLAAPLVAPLNPMVHRLRRQCGTSKGTVSLGTQLRGVRSKTCQRAAGWCGFNSPVFPAATAGRRGACPRNRKRRLPRRSPAHDPRRHPAIHGRAQRKSRCLSLTLSVSGASARRCTAPPMSGSQPNISTCACRFFFIAACEIMARLSASVVSSGHPAV